MCKITTAIIVSLLLTVSALGQFTEPYATDKVFPVVLVDATDGYTPETEKKAADTTITYCNITDGNSTSSYTDDATLWTEIGNGTGDYRLTIGAGEFATPGKRYFVKIVVSGCRTARFWVDTRKADPNLTATTTDGKTIPIDPNGLAKVVVHDASGDSPFATTDDLVTANETALANKGVTTARTANLDAVGQTGTTLQTGTAQAATASTITLATDANATDNYYSRTPQRVVINGGKGAGQSRLITSYTGSTKGAGINEAWVVIPDATSTYVIQPADSANSADNQADVTAAMGTLGYDAALATSLSTLTPLAADDILHATVPGTSYTLEDAIALIVNRTKGLWKVGGGGG
jgi:hypothetical protein